MNFAPFTGHIPSAAAMPNIHQFAAKFGYEGQERYQGGMQFAVAPGDKYRQAEGVVVVSSAPPGTVTLAGIAPLHTVNAGVKYQTMSSSMNMGGAGAAYSQQAYAHDIKEKREFRDDLTHDIMATMMQQQVTQPPLQQGTQQLLVVLHEPKEAAVLARAIKQESRAERTPPAEYISIGDVSDATWQSLGGGVADYLSALPLPLHHLLKYSDRRDEPGVVAVPPLAPLSNNSASVSSVGVQTTPVGMSPPPLTPAPSPALSPAPAPAPAPLKRKRKKKVIKEKKPHLKPGEIRLTTALDGSTLYCCPECYMAYPERGLLEQHLLGHTMERRFICDICNAALKRKDHLTRHKQSHNPERPHVCAVCLKGFKRKEQLTLHFVIHSGEKRHICNECGKGFYRKDHLRKHSRSHIARRVKAELTATAPPDS